MKRNLQMDGARGLSVLLVIIGHTIQFRLADDLRLAPFRELTGASAGEIARNLLLRLAAPLPNIGVWVFFVISGYIITALLIEEEDARGRINIGAFYIRRIFRIVPAFYAFLLLTQAFSAAGLISASPSAALMSSAYLCNFKDCQWWYGHTWSLAVEQQFYLAWPLLFIAVPGTMRSAFVAALTALFMSFSFASAKLLPFAFIGIGCAFALSSSARETAFRGGIGVVLVCLAGLFLPTFLASTPLYLPLTALAPLFIGVLVVNLLFDRGPLRALVRLRGLQALGVVSYSVYLWQQLATARVGMYLSPSFQYIAVPLAIVCALASYRVLEKPFVRIGRKLSSRLMYRSLRHDARDLRANKS